MGRGLPALDNFTVFLFFLLDFNLIPDLPINVAISFYHNTMFDNAENCYIDHLSLQKTSLAELVYMADNLAFFPYQTQDEPLFVMHQIDILVSVSGSNLIQSFREVRNLDFFSLLFSIQLYSL